MTRAAETKIALFAFAAALSAMLALASNRSLLEQMTAVGETTDQSEGPTS
jgi:hypothetical protein